MMKQTTTKEKINHPEHYGGDSIYEVIKVAEVFGFDKDAYLFNTFKYMARAGKKDGESELEDLEKSLFYLQRKINNLKFAHKLGVVFAQNLKKTKMNIENG